MRIVTWNVNGLEQVFQRRPDLDTTQLIKILDPDILCLQEIKSSRRKISAAGLSVFSGFEAYYSFPKNKSNYSGVLTLCKLSSSLPLNAWEGFDWLNETTDKKISLNSEGRLMMTDHGGFLLLNVYFPHTSSNERIEYRKEFNDAIDCIIYTCLALQRELIIVGDINAVYDPRDHCEYASVYKCSQQWETKKSEFFNHSSRSWFELLIKKHEWMVDSFRLANPNAESAFTCWNTYLNARPTNQGTRLDYILISKNLLNYVTSCLHLTDFMGSDHCPVTANFSLEHIIQIREKDCAPLALASINWSELKQTMITQFCGSKHSSAIDLESNELSNSATNKTRKKQTKLNDFFQKQNQEPFSLESSSRLSEASFSSIKKLKATSIRMSSAWETLLRPPPLPKCYHQEDAKEFRAKLKGPNQGRSFYACSRPGFATSNREATSSQDQRCTFFQWKNGPSKQKDKKN